MMFMTQFQVSFQLSHTKSTISVSSGGSLTRCRAQISLFGLLKAGPAEASRIRSLTGPDPKPLRSTVAVGGSCYWYSVARADGKLVGPRAARLYCTDLSVAVECVQGRPGACRPRPKVGAKRTRRSVPDLER